MAPKPDDFYTPAQMRSSDLALLLLVMVLPVLAISALVDILRQPKGVFGREGRSFYVLMVLLSGGVGGFAWFLFYRNRLRHPEGRRQALEGRR